MIYFQLKDHEQILDHEVETVHYLFFSILIQSCHILLIHRKKMKIKNCKYHPSIIIAIIVINRIICDIPHLLFKTQKKQYKLKK